MTNPADLLSVAAALVGVILGCGAAVNYCRTNDISTTRLVSVGGYALSFLGLFFGWLSFSVSSCVGIFCTSIGGSSGTANAFGIAGGIDPILQRKITAAVGYGNQGASTIQSLVNWLGAEAVIIIMCAMVALAVTLYSMSRPASITSPIMEDSFRPLLPRIAIVAAGIGFLIVLKVWADVSTLSTQYSDFTVTWGMGVGEFVTGLGLIVGGVARAMDPSVMVKHG